MATEVIYRHSSSSRPYTFDFTADLTGDTSLNAVDSGSTITATSSDGTDVSSTILSSKSASGMTLVATLGSMTEGAEYEVTYLAQGNTTSQIAIKVLKVLCRDDITEGV